MASSDDSSTRPRVLILGGGFAGVGAAQKLEHADAEVVLVDRHDYHTFQPLLYQLATGLLEVTAVGHSLRDLVGHHDNTTVHRATVSSVDLAAREARFEDLPPLTYDYLVLGVGAEVNFFGTEGAPEHAFRRVVRFGDGWMPFAMEPETLAPRIEELRRRVAEAGKPAPRIVAVTRLDLADRSAASARVRAFAAAGATDLVHGWRYAGYDDFRPAADTLAALDVAG